MEMGNIYKDIAARTEGNIYIGVVGPVRTGKSTFIKRFMDTVVIPNIEGDYKRERANDELPQSAAGRTIMTTEPKFVPEEAVKINIDSASTLNVRMVDCVGYIVPSSLGYIEDEQPRMVKTPWFDHEIPFNMAAEMGTKKVITEHSTIGLVITTDGSISDIDRSEYEEAEERVIGELKEINKPFIVLLNCMYPNSTEARELANQMSNKYGVGVIPVNCLDMDEDEIKNIIGQVLYEFPLKEININLPEWITALKGDHWLKKELIQTVRTSAEKICKIRELSNLSDCLCNQENVTVARLGEVNFGSGVANVEVTLNNDLFYQILTETTGLDICSDGNLMTCLVELAEIKKKYDRVKYVLEEVEQTGYGIVMPTIEELTLEEPEIVKQGSQYGVKLKASSPSIHMMRANIETEIAPVVGSEKQSEDLIKYLLSGFEDDPLSIWDSNIFGKSLHELVNEGLHAKLSHMPADARGKLQETIERLINEGCSGLICIIL